MEIYPRFKTEFANFEFNRVCGPMSVLSSMLDISSDVLPRCRHPKKLGRPPHHPLLTLPHTLGKITLCGGNLLVIIDQLYIKYAQAMIYFNPLYHMYLCITCTSVSHVPLYHMYLCITCTVPF